MRKHPHLYQIHTRVWLENLCRKYGRRLTLSTVPAEEWARLKHLGFDMIWLMGAWKKSPGAKAKALTYPDLRNAFDVVTPGWTPEDVSGSAYAIYDYSLDPALGAPGEMLALKEQLNSMGLRLMVDFVPNHLAFDHPWTAAHPGRFIQPKPGALQEHPDWFFETAAGVKLAHGRDPHFAPWSDTVQVNYFSDEAREAMTGELLRVAASADAVRCDMSMLLLNRVFGNVWGKFSEIHAPAREFWPDAISEVKKRFPEFVFLAEVYWDLEWDLQQMGFDYTYDKRLYDRLRNGTPRGVREHLRADPLFLERGARFIENHDETRASVAFGKERSFAAALASFTLPGMRFFHDGQFEGRRHHIPVQLGRSGPEPADGDIEAFYVWLLDVLSDPVFHEGLWRLLPVKGHGHSADGVLAWEWSLRNENCEVLVNYTGVPQEAVLQTDATARFEQGVPAPGSQMTYDFDPAHNHLRVTLGPWAGALFTFVTERA